ncbi:MAG: flagellar filament capping protein FliD [Alphaproteobacteria bacterium]|nr:flagellar filament capping protein FliD [Alphaproteobacteria bacterium]
MPAVDGVVSGFDTSGLIKSITEAALQPAVTMRKRKTGLEDKVAKITELSSLLQKVADAAGALGTEKGLASLKATSSSDLVRVSVDDEVANPGTYSIIVDRQATADTERSNTFASGGLGELSHGTLKITYGGTTHDIVIDGTNDGLEAVANQISEIDGLQAVAYDQGTGTKPWRLMISGETGVDNAITFDTSGLAGPASKKLAFTQTTAAQNARIRVNNVAIESASDTFTSLPGITIQLDGKPTGTQTIGVQKDFDSMVEKVKAFVDAYNEVQSFTDKQSVYNAEAGIKGPFSGESSVRRVTDSLANMVTAQYSTGSELDALSQIGVKTLRDGKLELDESALREALTERYDDVEKMLTSETGPLAEMQSRIEDVFVEPETGTLGSRKGSLEGSIKDLEDAIGRQEDYVDQYTERLRAKFSAMEAIMGQAQNTAGFLGAMLAGGQSSSQ